MRIGILQIAPRIGELDANIARADELLQDINPSSIDFLVLPELALTGYNFPSLKEILPFLEPTAAGPSARWAAATASRLNCAVTVGYPETTLDPDVIPGSVPVRPDHHRAENRSDGGGGGPCGTREARPEPTFPDFKNYNSTLTVDPRGRVLAHYRKTQLYYTDATWALPSPTGFRGVRLELTESSRPIATNDETARVRELSTAAAAAAAATTNTHHRSPLAVQPAPSASPPQAQPSPNRRTSGGAPPSTPPLSRRSVCVPTSFAICMDVSPCAFTAPWEAFELAGSALAARSRLVLASMAWLNNMSREELQGPLAAEPDWSTLKYWICRLGPLLEQTGTGTGEVHGEEEGGIAELGKEVGGGSSGDAAGAAAEAEWDADLPAGGFVSEGETLVVIANRAGIEPGRTKAVDLEKAGRGEVWEGWSWPKERETENGQGERSNAGEYIAGDGGVKESRKEALKEIPGAEPVAAKDDNWQLDEARYAGTSTVMVLGNGRAKVLGVLGRAYEGVLVADTNEPPESVFVLARRNRE